MVASKDSDLNPFTLKLTAPSLNIPVNKAEAPSRVTDYTTLLVEVAPSPPTLKERKLNSTFGWDVTKSHCRRAPGIGETVAANFGRHNQPQIGI